MNVNPNDEQLRAFVGMVAGRIGQEAPWNPQLGAYQLSSQNWATFAVKMHHYFSSRAMTTLPLQTSMPT